MKLSLNWLKEFVDLPDEIEMESLSHLITMTMAEVEKITPIEYSLDSFVGGDLPLKDYIIEIDNKSLTNRPDLWGHEGVARELSVIFGKPLKQVYTHSLIEKHASHVVSEKIISSIDANICKRLAFLEIDTLQKYQTPALLQSRMLSVGYASQNVTEDISNYIMFSTGQPIHTFDTQKIALPISIRFGKEDETLDVLDSKVVDLSGLPILCDNNGPIALLGIAEGDQFKVNLDTQSTSLILASLDAACVRRSISATGIRTEMSSRFDKAIDTQRIDNAISFAISYFNNVQPPIYISSVAEKKLDSTSKLEISITEEVIATRLGITLPKGEIQRILTRCRHRVEIYYH